MNRFLPRVLTVACSLAAFGLLAAVDVDPIRDRLEESKKKFLASLAAPADRVISDLKRTRKARLKLGRAEPVREIDKQLKAFEEWGRIPNSVSTESYRRKLGSATDALIKAYRLAEAEYTKAGELQKATAVEDELADFHRGVGFAQNVLGGEWTAQLDGDGFGDWSISRGDPSEWTVEKGLVSGAGQGDPAKSSFLMSGRSYHDFDLRCEFILPEPGDSGILLRAEADDRPCSLEVGLLHMPGSAPRLDLLWGTTPDRVLGPEVPFAPPGGWNRLQISIHDNLVKVWLNGAPAIQADLAQLSKSPGALSGVKRPSGRIGMQALTGTVRFRNIAVREAKP